MCTLSRGVAGYSNLSLLVHAHLDRLDGEVDRMHAQQGWLTLSVSRALARQLVDIPMRRRAAVVVAILEEAIEQLGSEVVVCTDLSLLFDPTHHLDPLALLRQLARERRLVVAWPGSYADGTLAYAVPEHSHYRTWSVTDLHIVALR